MNINREELLYQLNNEYETSARVIRLAKQVFQNEDQMFTDQDGQILNKLFDICFKEDKLDKFQELFHVYLNESQMQYLEVLNETLTYTIGVITQRLQQKQQEQESPVDLEQICFNRFSQRIVQKQLILDENKQNEIDVEFLKDCLQISTFSIKTYHQVFQSIWTCLEKYMSNQDKLSIFEQVYELGQKQIKREEEKRGILCVLEIIEFLLANKTFYIESDLNLKLLILYGQGSLKQKIKLRQQIGYLYEMARFLEYSGLNFIPLLLTNQARNVLLSQSNETKATQIDLYLYKNLFLLQFIQLEEEFLVSLQLKDLIDNILQINGLDLKSYVQIQVYNLEQILVTSDLNSQFQSFKDSMTLILNKFIQEKSQQINLNEQELLFIQSIYSEIKAFQYLFIFNKENSSLKSIQLFKQIPTYQTKNITQIPQVSFSEDQIESTQIDERAIRDQIIEEEQNKQEKIKEYIECKLMMQEQMRNQESENQRLLRYLDHHKVDIYDKILTINPNSKLFKIPLQSISKEQVKKLKIDTLHDLLKKEQKEKKRQERLKIKQQAVKQVEEVKVKYHEIQEQVIKREREMRDIFYEKQVKEVQLEKPIQEETNWDDVLTNMAIRTFVEQIGESQEQNTKDAKSKLLEQYHEEILKLFKQTYDKVYIEDQSRPKGLRDKETQQKEIALASKGQSLLQSSTQIQPQIDKFSLTKGQETKPQTTSSSGLLQKGIGIQPPVQQQPKKQPPTVNSQVTLTKLKK